MKVIIVAGGTGGHIYPGIAIAEELNKRDPNNKVLFISGKDGLGKTLITEEGYAVKLISAKGILRKISYHAISAPFVTLFGFFQSIFILLRFKPDCVIMTGGYVSFPVAFAAKLLGIKTILQEQNVLPGVTNRILSRFVSHVALSFEGSKKYISGVVTGNPVRDRIKLIKRDAKHSRKVLIVGGSQGALSINNAIISNISEFENKDIELFHIIGKRDYNRFVDPKYLSNFPFYHPISYMYNIEDGLSKADIVVSRAGATAISEFLVVGSPSILIPFPYSAEGHQDLNAQEIEKAGAAIVLKDSNIGQLSKLIIDLINDTQRLDKMAAAAKALACPDAAEKIVDLIYA